MINRESWFNAPVFSTLKIKASYGSQGNDAIGMYRYTDLYVVGNDGNDGFAIQFGSKGNPNITWETNSNLNIGAEFGLWNERLTGSVDFFYRLTSDMLFTVPVTPSLGYTSYWDNIGDMSNTGIEVVLNGDIVRRKNVNWSANLNLTWVKNKVLTLPESSREMEVDGHWGFVNGSTFIAEGLPLGTYFLPEYAGLNEYGDSQWWDYTPKYDADGNEIEGEWNKVGDYPNNITGDNKSKKLFGTSQPKVFGGFGTSLYAYGFDFSIAFDYQLGGVIYDGSYAGYMSSPVAESLGNNYHRDLLNAWTPDNTNTDIPRFQFGDKYTTSTSSRFLISSDYLNISNINAGYNFPAKWWKGHIQNLRVYVACDNVWYWSKRKGLDPRGTGTGQYSPIRTISGGVTLTF
jgi:hypothetical protein